MLLAEVMCILTGKPVDFDADIVMFSIEHMPTYKTLAMRVTLHTQHTATLRLLLCPEVHGMPCISLQHKLNAQCINNPIFV